MSLEQARKNLMAKIRDKGAICPCCGQFAKVYDRQINTGMARSLAKMYRRGLEWQHIPTTIGARSREEGKLAYWGLVEESTEPRSDGGRAGWWRVTPHGAAFIQGKIRLPKYALVYNAECLELDDSRGTVGFRDCLGAGFDFEELMRE